MTLDDLRRLCDCYVPLSSRHPNSLDRTDDLWWPAHEIGHLLTVDQSAIGEPMFGLDQPPNEQAGHEAICLELAAMSVSRRLLRTAGRPGLALREANETDAITLAYDDHGRVREILHDRRCLRLPMTAEDLEFRLRSLTTKPRRKRKADSNDDDHRAIVPTAARR